MGQDASTEIRIGGDYSKVGGERSGRAGRKRRVLGTPSPAWHSGRRNGCRRQGTCSRRSRRSRYSPCLLCTACRTGSGARPSEATSARPVVRPKSQSRSVFSGARRVRGLAPGGRAWFRSGRCFATRMRTSCVSCRCDGLVAEKCLLCGFCGTSRNAPGVPGRGTQTDRPRFLPARLLGTPGAMRRQIGVET